VTNEAAWLVGWLRFGNYFDLQVVIVATGTAHAARRVRFTRRLVSVFSTFFLLDGSLLAFTEHLSGLICSIVRRMRPTARPGRYSPELRERAVRMVFDHAGEYPSRPAGS